MEAKKANDYKFDISHLNLHYGDFHALKDVNMKIEANKITALSDLPDVENLHF